MCIARSHTCAFFIFFFFCFVLFFFCLFFFFQAEDGIRDRSPSRGLGDVYKRQHYNHTLLYWNKNFQDHRQEVVEMFDERFARMWELYLCACAATFMNGIIDLHQIIFTNDINNEIPMTKWY